MTAHDSDLRCSVCGRESTTGFASSLRHGWEKCCGYTMTLVRSEADIESALANAIGDGPRSAAAAVHNVAEQVER